ncbi:hypothetical protein MLD38_001469 [Melastoma candidum]|uniref:Uncharacterized protein n=1 Tax=Melastoma candidum TaxID=119954 RepID=A0ACB9SCQ3_9MYRT|nr:hypothetical protein MLD38_001469 [Melastoma candidum]
MEASAWSPVMRVSIHSNRVGRSSGIPPSLLKQIIYRGLPRIVGHLSLNDCGGPCPSTRGDRAPAFEAGNLFTSLEATWLLKKKGQEVRRCLAGRSIFLVGMMGSGKTTVGEIMSEALGYTFIDSDKYVEQTLGLDSVAQIFKQCGEKFFRDYESDALQQLSMMGNLVVATGGGAVIRPVNWEYMKQGLSVYLDVPVDALARRIAAVGTNSRPLLDFDSGDPYTKAFIGLFTLSKKRAQSYSSADVTVSLLADLAANLGVEDVSDLTPTAIATEVLVQVEKFLGGGIDSLDKRTCP